MDPRALRWWSLGGVLCLLVLRLVYLNFVELLPEEAYYWDYTEHPALSYLDHPPMVAWLIKIGTLVFGHTAFGVRIGSVLCGGVATAFCFLLTQKLFDRTTALVAALLLQTLPIFFVTGFVMTPDAPLVACWAAALWFLHRALVEGKTSAFLGVGVSFGLGLLSKYTMALLAFGALIFVLTDKRARRWLWHPAPWLAVLLALILFSPVIVWNARNDWASFAFQSSRRIAAAPHFSVHFLLGSILALLAPTGFLAATVALVGKGNTEARSATFLKMCALVPLAVFVIFSLRHRPQLNWTGPLWLAVVPLLAAGITRFQRLSATWLERFVHTAWLPTFGILGLGFAAMLHQLAFGWPGVPNSSRTELLPMGWRDLGWQISEIEKQLGTELGAEYLLYGADKNAIASELAFYSATPSTAATRAVGGHLFGGKGLMYEFWFPPKLQAGKNLLLVGFEREDLSHHSVRARLEKMGPISEGSLRRDGKIIRPFFFRVGYGYHAERTSSGATSLP